MTKFGRPKIILRTTQWGRVGKLSRRARTGARVQISRDQLDLGVHTGNRKGEDDGGDNKGGLGHATHIVCLKWSSGLYHSHSVAVSFNHSIVFVLSVLLFSFVNTYNSKNEKRVLNAFWTASPTHFQRVAGKAFESISDRLRNAPEMRLWQCVLNPFEIRL